jgi:phosphatidylserine/phosphatidylglycerophosphate/cardiolipin synthase-like enzyme
VPLRAIILIRRTVESGVSYRPSPAKPAEIPTAKPVTVKPAVKQDGITVYFSPRGGCTAAIVEQVAGAKKSVNVLAYRLTSIPVVKALADAHDRGVQVSIVLDKTQQSEKYSDATYFHNRGMTVLADPKHAIAHDKVIIVDDRMVITGSFNFSTTAEDDNAENLLVIEDKADLTAAYLKTGAAATAFR